MQEDRPLPAEGSEGYLMESWPDDPEDGILAMILSTMAFTGERRYADGAYLVRRGDHFQGTFMLEEGSVEVEYIHGDSEGDSEDEVCSALFHFHCRDQSSWVL